MRVRIRKIAYTVLAVLFWLLVWELAARKVNETIFLPAPARVFLEFVRLPQEKTFYRILWGSVRRIGTGFFAGALAGAVCTALACSSEWLRALISVPIRLMKTVPVASFVILLLLWVDTGKLTALIAFFLVVPVFYENLYRGTEQLDVHLKEAARVYRFRLWQKFRYLLLPGEMPYFKAASGASLGMCFKAGVAAEVIGHVKDSIGVQLYEAKLWLDTPLLFAWTLWLLAVSVVFSGAVLLLVSLIEYLFLGNPGKERKGKAAPGENTEAPGENAEAPGKNADASGENADASGENTDASGSVNLPKTHMPFGSLAASLSDVTKSYQGRLVVNHVSAEFTTGSMTILFGPSGCGKTTLLRILLGLTVPETGVVRRMSRSEWSRMSGLEGKNMPREAAGVCFQEDRLCLWATARKNVQLGGTDLPKEEICRRLQLCGIQQPDSRPVSEFSGGMKRRVAVLRALLSASPLCILDEPFFGLDAERKQYLMELTVTKASDTAVVIVTHNASEIEYFKEKIENLRLITFAPETSGRLE